MSAYATWFHKLETPNDNTIDGDLVRKAYADTIIDLIAKEDDRFARVDRELFDTELIALRAEIFGLAWGHAFRAKDKHLLGEGKVAKSALVARGLWDRAEKYNQAAARSSKTALPTDERKHRGAVAFQNSWRMNMFQNWTKTGADPEVAARIINRMFTEESWKSGATLRHLTAELIATLGFANAEAGDVHLNEQALTTLQYPLLDIYQGSREGIAKLDIKAD